MKPRPHVLGIDDGPFEKGQQEPVPIVGVMMEGGQRVESIAVHHLPVDCDAPTARLGEWIGGLRVHPSLQALLLGGITIAGLGVVDIRLLSSVLGLPVVVVNRKDPEQSRLVTALESAGLSSRIPIVDASPTSWRQSDGLYLAAAGIERATAERLVAATLDKALWPEPLRIAHLFARAMVTGESRGRA